MSEIKKGTSALKKGWCPSARRPMRSGDGLLVRLRLSCSKLNCAQAREIAALSQRHGNGEIDLTTRGGLQLRGVTDESYPELIASLAAADLIEATPEAEAARNVLVSPFAGLGGADDPRPAACAWERTLANSPDLWRLPGKFGFAFDAGGLPMGDDSDIRFEAQGQASFVARLGGAAGVLGPFPAADLVAVARALVAKFLSAEDAPRMRDAVRLFGLQPFAAATGLNIGHAAQRPAAPLAAWLGPHILGARAFVGAAAPFGRLHADQLAALADLAGANALRLTPWRALIVGDLEHPAAHAFSQAAQDLGLIVDPRDPLLRIAACPGAPACSSALQETRDAALGLSAFAPSGEGVWLHLSGCEKGCAHPRPAPMNVVASPEGYRLNGESPRTLESLAPRLQALAPRVESFVQSIVA